MAKYHDIYALIYDIIVNNDNMTEYKPETREEFAQLYIDLMQSGRLFISRQEDKDVPMFSGPFGKISLIYPG